jgi:hypothetical protein
MSVLNVISTTTVASGGTGYIEMTSGVFRITAATACTVKINDGPAVVIKPTESLLLSGGKARKAPIYKASDSATCVYTLGLAGATTDTHPFAVGDYVAVVDSGSVLPSAFESAASAGKKVTAKTGYTITTDIDASAADADFTHSTGVSAQVVRVAKLEAIGAEVVFEQVQVVGG